VCSSGENLANLRQKAGLTQRKLAQEMGFNVQRISNWETGRKNIVLSPAKMLKLCNLLQCGLADLAHCQAGEH